MELFILCVGPGMLLLLLCGVRYVLEQRKAEPIRPNVRVYGPSTDPTEPMRIEPETVRMICYNSMPGLVRRASDLKRDVIG